MNTQNIPAGGEQGYFTILIISAGEVVGDAVPEMSIQIHSQLVDVFAGNDSTVRVVSYIYYNISNLFPSGRPGENE